MKKFSLQVMFRCFGLIGLIFLTGCASPYFSPTSTISVVTATPEKLQLLNGRLNACQLLTVSEIESVLGTKTSTDPIAFEGGIGCRYIFSTAEPPAFAILIFTEIKVGSLDLQYTVDEWFEIEKQNNLELAAKISDITVEDVPELGKTAYYMDGSTLNLFILNNGIEYVFITHTPDYGGKGSLQALIALAEIAQPRMP